MAGDALVFIGLPILPTHVLFIQHESISCIVWERQAVLGFLWTQNFSLLHCAAVYVDWPHIGAAMLYGGYV